jgi:hypothetical protein
MEPPPSVLIPAIFDLFVDIADTINNVNVYVDRSKGFSFGEHLKIVCAHRKAILSFILHSTTLHACGH